MNRNTNYYTKNKKKILSSQKKYIKANPELRAEIKHRSYIKNAWTEVYYAKNRDKILAYGKMWRQKQRDIT
jgi:hypothetical protein